MRKIILQVNLKQRTMKYIWRFVLYRDVFLSSLLIPIVCQQILDKTIFCGSALEHWIRTFILNFLHLYVKDRFCQKFENILIVSVCLVVNGMWDGYGSEPRKHNYDNANHFSPLLQLCEVRNYTYSNWILSEAS